MGRKTKAEVEGGARQAAATGFVRILENLEYTGI